MPVIFDVGANDGNTCFHLCRDPRNMVYAFEPTPSLLKRLNSLAQMVSNYHVIPVAVSNTCGIAQFNIVSGDEWSSPNGESGGGGCSSLCTLGENEKLKTKETIDVTVTTLEQFIEDHDIKQIDFLHCDVQGKDLEVLMGLGKYANRVKRGCIEMPRCLSTRLYDSQVFDTADAVRWLHENGFLVDTIESNDEKVNEVNLTFHRIDENDLKSVPFKPLII